MLFLFYYLNYVANLIKKYLLIKYFFILILVAIYFFLYLNSKNLKKFKFHPIFFHKKLKKILKSNLYYYI